jgi:hypothetical protein
MEADDVDPVDVLVAGQPIAISTHERAKLLERLRIVAGDAAIVRKFEFAWLTRRVDLDDDDLGRLRMPLELWKATALDELPDGIAHLLAAIQGAAPGGDADSTTANE